MDEEIKRLTEQAEQGHPDAQFKLERINHMRELINLNNQGKLLFNLDVYTALIEGYYYEGDREEAVKWYRRAINDCCRDSDIYNNLDSFIKEPEVEISATDAVRIYSCQLAAEAGDADAQLIYGLINFFDCLDEEFDEDYFHYAIEWWAKAAEQGKKEAIDFFGMFIDIRKPNLEVEFEREDFVLLLGLYLTYFAKDKTGEDEKLEWYKKAAHQGFNGLFNSMNHFCKSEIYGDNVVDFYQGDNGYANIGFAYLCGIGVKQDTDSAIRWFFKGIEEAHGKGAGIDDLEYDCDYFAALGLGLCYLKTERTEEATKWLRKAAEYKIEEAQQLLGEGHNNGNGASKQGPSEAKPSEAKSKKISWKKVWGSLKDIWGCLIGILAIIFSLAIVVSLVWRLISILLSIF